MADDDDTEYRIVRRKRRRDTDRQTPRALATGSRSFGRILPVRVEASQAEEPAPSPPLEGAVVLQFGDYSISVEHRGAAVVVVFPDGSRAVGSREQADQLGRLLLGPRAPRR